MVEKSFGANQAREFIKTLVELGDTHYVDNNNLIVCTGDNSPVGATVNIGGKDVNRPIQIFYEGMQIGDFVVLNPFVELLGRHDEVDWFLKLQAVLPGVIIWKTLIAMAEHAVSKEDTGFKAAKALSKFIGRIDERFLKEVGKLRPLEIAHIYYDRKQHVAQLQSDICSKDFQEQISGRIRKSSIKLIEEIVKFMLKVEKCPEEIDYKATMIGCYRFDAIAHVVIDVVDRIDDVVEAVTDMKLHADELKAHLENMEAYQRSMAWLTSTTGAVTPKDKGPKTVSVQSIGETPWKSAVTSSGSIATATPVTGVSAPQFPNMVMGQQFVVPQAVPMVASAAPITACAPAFGGFAAPAFGAVAGTTPMNAFTQYATV